MDPTPLPTPLPIAEIVSFTLTPGTDPDRFARAAAALDPWLASAPGFLDRCLSCGPDGVWTDHVLWADLPAAMAAAEALPTRPEAAVFLAAIDPSSVAMRHAQVLHRPTA